MTTGNVVAMPEPLDKLAQRIRSALERTEHGRAEWIEGTLELAAALAEGRQRHSSNRAFSMWLSENDLDQLGAHDRAALIEMNKDAALFREVLSEQAEQHLPNTIWHKVRTRFGMHFKTEATRIADAQSCEKPPANPEICAQAPIESIAKEPVATVPLSPRSPFYGLKRAEEVTAIFVTPNTRSVIGKALKNGDRNEIWLLILAAIDYGFLTRTESDFSKASLRILFPGAPSKYCKDFDLTKRDERKRVRDRIMPAAIAHREAVLAAPEKLEDIVNAHWTRCRDEARKVQEDKDAAVAMQALPQEQREEIVMFGTRLWPRDVQASYEYDDLRVAIWYFRDMDRWLSTYGDKPNDVGNRAINIRQSMRWWSEYADRVMPDEPRARLKRAYQLVNKLTGLMERNPDGECRAPPSPKIQGQW